MKRFARPNLFALVAIALVVSAMVRLNELKLSQNLNAAEKESASMMLAHNVFFSLNESTPANRQRLVDACKKYLSTHPGTVFFAAGTPADYDRPVNDRDFDVALHLVFQDHASHDAYQTAPMHEKFIAENKSTWKKVRVFDSEVIK